jgi:hypothetical protein
MNEKILAALAKLDRTNDNHWTQDHKPRIEAVRFLAGDQSVTREDIEAASPGFSRLPPQNSQEKVDASAATVQPSFDADAQTEQDAQVSTDDEITTAKKRLAVARDRKAEADQEFAAATLAVDKLIEAGAEPPETISRQIQAYQARQREILEERATKLQALKGVPLKDILPQRAPIDIAFQRKTARGGQRPV